MKIRLLNDGRYPGLESVSFPVEVEAEPFSHGFRVSYAELERIGADMECFYDPEDPFWPFTKGEFEVVE